MQTISFVLPIYNEQDNIPRLWEELSSLKSKIEGEFKLEFIFVNDGSKDNSINELIKIKETNKGVVKIIDFARNIVELITADP